MTHLVTPNNTEPATAEMWLPVVGWEGFYSVSDLGRVRSESRRVDIIAGRKRPLKGRILRACPASGGYLQVTLSRRNVQTNRTIHPMVLEAFVGPRPAGMEACHWNGQAADNRLGNLRWDTPKSNAQDKVRAGTVSGRQKTHCPRDHELVAPNLVACLEKKGYRDCLSCNRGRTAARNARVRRGEHLDWEAIADQKYAELMDEAAA